MFPEINNNFENDSELLEENDLGETYLFDFDTGEFVLEDGKLVKASLLESAKIWVEKMIWTEKNKYDIYSTDEVAYGTSINNLIGKKYPKVFIESEVKRILTDDLLKHPLINSLSSFNVGIDGAKTNVSFKVNLINNQTFEMEV